MTTPTTSITTPFPQVRNAGNTGSFFAAQQENPTGNPLIVRQVDPTSPQVQGLNLVSDPIQPSGNARIYTANFDPALYDLRDSSHLMRLLRAFTGSAGTGAIQKQYLVARLINMLSGASFLDLDKFYGEIFHLQRHTIESLPQNLDGTTVDPYTDLANSDLWDAVISRDARYRARLFLLARAINMGCTFPGLQSVAEAVLNCDVDIAESWVKADFLNSQQNLLPSVALTYLAIEKQFVTYGNITKSYGALEGEQFGEGQLPSGNRGELVFTPHRSISPEERYQLQAVLNTVKPTNTQITIATTVVESSTPVTARGYSSDSENWQIQARVTPALNLINPGVGLYTNSGPYSLARPVFSEYTGEQWTYVPNVLRTASYRIVGVNNPPNIGADDQAITYSDNSSHVYASSDSIKDVRQAIAFRMSGEGVVTNMPYFGNRPNYSNMNGLRP